MEEKKSVLGFEKVFMDQCESVLVKKIVGVFFFGLAVEKKKSLISQCTNYFTECCSVCNCFSISATSIPTSCGLISVAS